MHSASIEIALKERVKTDKRDSKKIAVQLVAERLKSIYIPDKQREDYRIISRLRETLANNRAKKVIQLKSLLFQLGRIRYNDDSRISKNGYPMSCPYLLQKSNILR